MTKMTALAKRTLTLGALVSGIVLVVLPVVAQRADAHPLGNFTVNRYARIELSTSVVRVYYVLDEAEIPAFEDRDALRSNQAAFVQGRIESIRRHIELMVDRRPISLRATDSLLSQPSGQGGLPTLRIAIRFEGSLTPHAQRSVRATFADANEPDRVGWREIVVVARGDAHLQETNTPVRDVSDELRKYPANLIQAPLDQRSAAFTFIPGQTAVAPATLTSPNSAPNRSGSAFSDLITRKVTPFALAAMIGLALMFGAGHALAPGHGKTVMAAYLVGTRGRPIDAVFLGSVVSVMHTASVLVLALVLYQINRSTPIDRVYPALTLASGTVVVGFGVFMLVNRLRSHRTHRRRTAEHEHVGDEHEHGHHHGHGRRHAHQVGIHTHDPAIDAPPLSRRGLIVLATSGGLLPSPSAVLVLLAAFATGRAPLGLGLVAAFSVGLAVTLTGVGLALVFGGRAIERRSLTPPAFIRWLPVGSALAIIVAGSVVIGQGITRL